MRQYRQGDLLLVLQDGRPREEPVVRPGDVLVAGEATGHAHRLTAGTILEAPDGALSLDIPHTSRVVHEEHDPITLDAGPWPVVRQRAYSPEAIRSVRD